MPNTQGNQLMVRWYRYSDKLSTTKTAENIPTPSRMHICDLSRKHTRKWQENVAKQNNNKPEPLTNVKLHKVKHAQYPIQFATLYDFHDGSNR